MVTCYRFGIKSSFDYFSDQWRNGTSVIEVVGLIPAPLIVELLLTEDLS